MTFIDIQVWFKCTTFNLNLNKIIKLNENVLWTTHFTGSLLKEKNSLYQKKRNKSRVDKDRIATKARAVHLDTNERGSKK